MVLRSQNCRHYAPLFMERVEISCLKVVGQWLAFPFFIWLQHVKIKENKMSRTSSVLQSLMFTHVPPIIPILLENSTLRGHGMFLLQCCFSCNLFSNFFIKIFPGYIKNFEVFDPHRVGKITVELQGRIKDCKALTYRQDLRATEIEKYRTRMLPTRQVFCQLINSYVIL